jgi:hypothetical protein
MCECTANISLVATALLVISRMLSIRCLQNTLYAPVSSPILQHWEAYLFLQAPHRAFVPSGKTPPVVGTSILSIASL